MFAVYFILTFATNLLKINYYEYLRYTASCVDLNSTAPFLDDNCKCAYLYPSDSKRYVSHFNFYLKIISFLCHYRYRSISMFSV